MNISLNKELLSSYTEEQLKQWAADNKLTDAELKEVKADLKSNKEPGNAVPIVNKVISPGGE